MPNKQDENGSFNMDEMKEWICKQLNIQQEPKKRKKEKFRSVPILPYGM